MAWVLFRLHTTDILNPAIAPASSNRTNDNSQVAENVFSIGYTYDLILFGEGIAGGQFVLTKTPGNVGNNCNNYGHTNSQYIIGSGESGSVGFVKLDTSKEKSEISMLHVDTFLNHPSPQIGPQSSQIHMQILFEFKVFVLSFWKDAYSRRTLLFLCEKSVQ